MVWGEVSVLLRGDRRDIGQHWCYARARARTQGKKA
jgi:hypothetical protein